MILYYGAWYVYPHSRRNWIILLVILVSMFYAMWEWS
jgi:hypothetical protein